MTKMLDEYSAFKSEFPDFILLFRMGGFYETYFEDALAFSNTTGVTLTRRKFKNEGAVLMAGVSTKFITSHISKLIQNGYKVVIVDEIGKDEKTGRMIREVTKIYTQGTLVESDFLNSKENNYIASITKSDSNYGITYADVSTGAIFTSSGNLDDIKCELARISPKELLVDENANIEESLYLPYKYVLLDDSYFPSDKAPSISSMQAVFTYSTYILKEFVPKFDNVKEYNINKNLLIDYKTRKNLELTKNAFNNKKEGSLIWALDKCKTPMGKRLFANYLTSPILDENEIKKRHQAVFELLKKSDTAQRLGSLLEDTGDILRLTSRLSNSTITPLEFLFLKEGLKTVKEIDEIEKELTAPLLRENSSNKNLLKDFYEILDKTIVSDIEEVKAGNYINKGANDKLDSLNFDLEELYKQIEEYVLSLKQKTGIKALKIVNVDSKFFIEIPNSSTNVLNCDLKAVKKLSSHTRYTDSKLENLEEQIYALKAKILETKENILENLRKYSKEMTENVRIYSNKLALLDVMYCYFANAKEYNLTPPSFSKTKFELKEAVHIPAKKILNHFEPLDINFDDSNSIILTGKNGIGKSTLAKLIGIVTVMAQSGLFVPAKIAILPIADRLFSILSVSDEVINKKSTHQAQMNSIAYIFKNLTDRSIILLDEIGKSTSYKEGLALSYAIIRRLAEISKAKTVFVTHFLDLKNLCAEFSDKISFYELVNDKGIRKVYSGIIKASGGIDTAVSEGVPDEVIEYANLIQNSV